MKRLLASLIFASAVPLAFSADPVEADFYKITTFETPKETALEVGSIELLPDGRLALGTRRGEIWTVSGAGSSDPTAVTYKVFASGLHEVLGLAYNPKDKLLYATTRYEITRLKDVDGDGRADVFDNVSDAWGVSGDYHEYAIGSRYDKAGDLWVTLCLTGSFSSQVPFRGWALRVKPDGTMVPTCSGIRSPGGMGFDADGEVYYCDNQGPWHGSCTLQHLVPGSFQGHPGGNVWYDLAKNMGPRPVDPIPEAFQGERKRNEARPGGDPDRMVQERQRIRQLLPPAVYLVHGKIGNSATAIICDLSGGKFGPFGKQLFVGEFVLSGINRVFLEKVGGEYQGACFPFLDGLQCAVLTLNFLQDGSMVVGQTNRGWNSYGNRPYGLQRLVWTNALGPDFRPKPQPKDANLEFFFVVDLRLAPLPNGGTSYTATVMHQDEASRQAHEDMGFQQGWGIALDQLVELMR